MGRTSSASKHDRPGRQPVSRCGAAIGWSAASWQLSGTTETFYRAAGGALLGISTLTPGGPGKATVDYEAARVPTITLNDLLNQHDARRVDLLSLDIAGAEPLALSAFDIDRYKPALAVVEVHADTSSPVLEYFAAHSYERIGRYGKFDFANYYFTPKRSGH